MKYLTVFLTFILIAAHGISTAHALTDQSVAAVDSLELCPNFITHTPVGDCGSYLFNLNHIGDFGNMIWNWGDGGSNSGANNVGHTFMEPGEYLVCVQAWTGDCPEGVEVCITLVVPECEFECPEGIVATPLECGLWEFVIEPGTAVTGGGWVFGDGQSAQVSGNSVTHEFAASGEYTIHVNSILSQPCFNNYFTVTIDVQVCEAECGLQVEIVSEDGNMLFMQASDFPEGAQIHWELNGNIVAIDSVAVLELEPGENEICVYYETPECPQGVFWCETFTIEDPNDCPYQLIVEETDECGCYDFAISNAGAGGAYMWNMGDTAFVTLNHTVSYCFEAGFQTVYVQITNSNHPACNNAPLVHQWEVPECNDECTLDVEVIHDGDMLYFNPYNYPDDASISWQLNGELLEQDENFSVDISAEGVYEICAAYETPECPQGVFWCDEFYGVELECPAELYVLELEDCGCYIFSINPPNIGGSYMWNFGDNTFVSDLSTVTHCFEAGFQTMYVQIMNSIYLDCNNTPLVHQWQVPECDDPCGLEVQTISQDGNLLVLQATDYPSNAQIHWELNGSIVNIGDITTFELEPGENEICVYYETPECPQGVFWCETFTIEDPNDCPYQLIVEETDECGCYDFAISEQGAGGYYMWNLGDTAFTSLSHTVSYCFEPGFQITYVHIMGSNYPDCSNAPLVHEWEVPECDDPDCYWFAFQIETNIPGVSFGLDWTVNDLNGEQWGSGTIEVEGGTTSYTGEVCIGVGCYILEFQAPFPINLESLDIDFISIINPLIPVTIEWIQDDNPYTVTAQIEIAETCNWSVSIDENALEMTQVYPVPAQDVLNIQLSHEAQTDLRLYNVSGQIVLQQSLQQSGPIDVSSLPAGLYLLQLQQGNDFKTFSIPLLN